MFTRGPADVNTAVAPLPFGPNDQSYYKADGNVERATAEELYQQKEGDDIDLCYYVPGQEGDASWHLAVRPKLPLHNAQGEVVDEATWKNEQKAASNTFWTNSISRSASGSLPAGFPRGL
mgnify:CR=1 FL=1